MGAHQKIDRVARRHLGELLPPTCGYPSFRDIVQFEGINGPDGVKRKSPARDEPWHYLNPLGNDHQDFLAIINKHYAELVTYLKRGNMERSAFEAAWLAHAIVDGLTPAHHYPYEQKLVELRDGKGIETRTTITQKLIFRGDTAVKTFLKNYSAYGPKGLMSSHVMFEFGFMWIIRPLRFPDARPTAEDIQEIKSSTIQDYFLRVAREVAVLDMYESYLKLGWTSKLSNQVRHDLAPLMVKIVTLVWYKAADEAGLCVPMTLKEHAA
jgi:hypothetical protein